jgi:hypothetical protein
MTYGVKTSGMMMSERRVAMTNPQKGFTDVGAALGSMRRSHHEQTLKY